MHAKICTKSNMSEQIDLQEIYGLCLVEMTMFRNLGVPRILQWRGFTGVDPGSLKKGAEQGGLGFPSPRS